MSDGETHGDELEAAALEAFRKRNQASDELEAMAARNDAQAERVRRERAAQRVASALLSTGLDLLVRAGMAVLSGQFNGDADHDGELLADHLWSERRARSAPPWSR